MQNLVRLDDRYRLAHGRVLLSGTQALVRLLLEQHAVDAAAGRRTAGYVSGYRGSPLGGLDLQLNAARADLEAAGVRFLPGVNEDLAATAIWGTQQVGLLSGATVEGVYALWYGKGPGVDRSGDPLKHANRAGTAPLGGVLVVCGDDHGGKSSTVSHQSDPVLAAHGLPVLYPATVQEFLDLGLHGWALSRHAGVWVGFKTVNETVEATATVEVGPGRVQVVLPDAPPEPSVSIRMHFDPLDDDCLLQREKLPRVWAYARLNGLDCVSHGPAAPDGLGIVTAGKTWLDVLSALALLGLEDARDRAEVGLSVYKLGLISPVEPEGLVAFARGQREVLVIEEKIAFVEVQAARVLYGLTAAERPALSGKCDADGQMLLPSDVPLDPLAIAMAIGRRLLALGRGGAPLRALVGRLQEESEALAARNAVGWPRLPYFCSGCPHNTSTRVPDGSLAFGGIGCHTMALFMDRSTLPPTQMGGEGANWIGIAPFTDLPHAFQNLGDGTYFHSGLLAVRAAVTAGVNLTYKILYNDAVAMTGGQPVEGHLSVAEITHQLRAERIQRIAVVSDDCEKYGPRPGFAPGTTVHHRRELDAVQRELRAVTGVSALIYDQVCATEKRRRRKRGRLAEADRRMVINPLVCEGCGDCSVQANCLSIEPLETQFGRKRRIEQSSCNKDYSCVEGLCPSFVSLSGAEPARQPRALAPVGDRPANGLPLPLRREGESNVLIAGIGGTGVVTVGALLAMAAHIEGLDAQVFDMTGLAQKGGAVTSHVKIAARGRGPVAPRVGPMQADLVLGCDLTVASAAESLRTVQAGRTTVLVNTHLVPTAHFQRQRDIEFNGDAQLQGLRHVAGADAVRSVECTEACRLLLGDTVGANTFLLGYALQRGCLPVGLESLQQALRLNGVAVELNLAALDYGRRAAADPEGFAAMLQSLQTPPVVTADRQRRVAYLTDYQDVAYAARYLAWVERVERRESEVSAQSRALTLAVEVQYFRLLAAKDEYEVARLLTAPEFDAQLRREFSGNPRRSYHLAPPLFASRDPVSGRPRKRRFGPWLTPVLKTLARLRRVRGTVLDPFRWSEDRRLERDLLREYEALLEDLLPRLRPDNLAAAVELAALPSTVRGYGVVREQAASAMRERRTRLWAAFTAERA